MDNAIDYLVIVLYFVPMFIAGYWGYRRATSAEDFLVAGRRLGPVMYSGTLSATTLGGPRRSAGWPWATSSASLGCGSRP